MTMPSRAARMPRFGRMTTRAFALFGVIWSIFGAYQFFTATLSGTEHLLAMGLTARQADLYANSPLWMDAAFAAGVFGGIAGSLLLALLRRSAVPVLTLSLAGYCVLYAGDIVTGVFAAFGPPQVAVLTSVVLIAAALLWVARRARAAGWLT